MTNERRDPLRQRPRADGRRTTDKIACPDCGSYQSIVKDVRQSVAGLYRRRQCLDCATRYSTEEVFRRYSTKRTKAEREHKI